MPSVRARFDAHAEDSAANDLTRTSDLSFRTMSSRLSPFTDIAIGSARTTMAIAEAVDGTGVTLSIDLIVQIVVGGADLGDDLDTGQL